MRNFCFFSHKSTFSVIFSLFFALFCVSQAATSSSVHVGIHRHLHQPIYWGTPDSLRPDQSQFGNDSQRIKNENNAYYGDTIQHPDNILVGGNDSVFEDPDKVSAYQHWIKGSIGQMTGEDAGMTISFSGALQRNLWSFGRDYAAGYTPSWNAENIEAYGWQSSGGNSKAEVLGQTYNHAFTPLLPKTVLRKQIEMQRERTRKSWAVGTVDDLPKGFWPIELAFSEQYIDVLREFGYEWVMVPNSHIARTVQNYTQKALDAGLLNADPPNKADLLGPTVPDDQWYNNNRDTYGNAFPVPYAYQCHRAKYVDPVTGAESIIVVVPQCDFHGYQSGYSQVGWQDIDGKISEFNDPDQPSLVMLTNDGENFWGGGYSFWMEFAAQFMNDAPNHGKKATTIQEFLDDHPVPSDDIIHVEDGSWLAADQGSPQFYRWLEPPRQVDPAKIDYSDANTMFDLENGFHTDMRNWAVMYAGINHCETAEQITLDNGGEVVAWRIEEPYQDDGTYNNPNAAEQAWHFLMWGFDSGFLYFGTALDDEVKHTFAANEAIARAASVIGDGSQDATPPTTFKPQRFPWNPGGKGRGQYLGGLQSGGGTVGYTTPPWSSDFYVWTLAYDLSGISSATLKVRVDANGINPLDDNANEVYAGGNGVGAWISIPMTRRIMPKDDPTDNPGLNYFREPDQIADYFWVKVTGYRNQLLDYYIETVDTKGNITKTEIQHVYVEDDGTSPSPVTFSANPTDCDPLEISYDSSERNLSTAVVTAQISYDGGSTWSQHAMSGNIGSTWTLSLDLPEHTPSVTVCFHDGAGTYDNNDGNNWSTPVTHCLIPSEVAFSPAAPVGCDPVTISYTQNEGALTNASEIYIHIGHDGWKDVIDPAPLMTFDGEKWNYTYTLPQGCDAINVAFHDGNGTWDNNSGNNWSVNVTACDPPPALAITNPAAPVNVANTVTTYGLAGTCDTSILSGSITWSNALSGGTGSTPVAGEWQMASVPLAVGTNTLIITATNAGSTTAASDDAANADYDAGWANTQNGGTGFSAWQLSNNENSGFFTATPAEQVNQSLAGRSWGLWANTEATAEAIRPFAQDMQVGDTFSVSLDNNWIEDGHGIGIALQNSAGDTLWQFFFNGGDTYYNMSGIPATGIDWTGDGIDLEFTLTDAATFDCTVMPYAGTVTNLSGPLNTAEDQTITRFRAWNYSAGANSNYNFYINNLELTGGSAGLSTSDTATIIRAPSAQPDQDDDGLPDAWETQYFSNATNASASADSDGDGLSNYKEFLLGTHPLNGESLLVMDYRDMPQTATSHSISWQTIGGRSYWIEYTDDLSQPFQRATSRTENDVANGLSDTETFIDYGTLTGGLPPVGRYYRIMLKID
jgi:hypothetical protein